MAADVSQDGDHRRPPGERQIHRISSFRLRHRFFQRGRSRGGANGSYRGIPRPLRLQVNRLVEAFIADHIERRVSCAFETTLRSGITFEQAAAARAAGFVVERRYLVLQTFEMHVERIKMRADRGGHSASNSVLRGIYESSIANLGRAIREMDFTGRAEPREQGTKGQEPRRACEDRSLGGGDVAIMAAIKKMPAFRYLLPMLELAAYLAAWLERPRPISNSVGFDPFDPLPDRIARIASGPADSLAVILQDALRNQDPRFLDWSAAILGATRWYAIGYWIDCELGALPKPTPRRWLLWTASSLLALFALAVAGEWLYLVAYQRVYLERKLLSHLPEMLSHAGQSRAPVVHHDTCERSGEEGWPCEGRAEPTL